MARGSAAQTNKTGTANTSKFNKTKKPARRQRHTIAAARGVHKWNTEKRKFLHLIFTEFKLANEDFAALIHACFPDMMQVRYDADYRKFYDIWIGRNNASHAKEWSIIARPRPAVPGKRPANLTPYTAAELADFARIRASVHQVAAANNIALVLSTCPTSRELHAPSGAIIAPGPLPQPAQIPTHTGQRKAPKSGPKRNPRTPSAKGKQKTAAVPTGMRTRGQAAILTYREDSNEDSADEEEEAEDVEEQGEDEVEAEQTEDEVEEEQPHESEEENEESFYGAAISEPGYDISDIRGPRFRNATTVKQRKALTTPTRLAMVHHGSLSTVERRDGDTIVSADISQRFGPDLVRAAEMFQTDNDAYHHGGAALRVYFPASDDSPAHFADVMICDTTQCANAACQDTAEPYTFTSMTRSGKPFVHWEDCASDENGELEFFPDHVKGPTTITVDPAYIEEEDIIFHNGFEKILVQALVCSEGDCLRCNARKAAGEADEEMMEDGEEVGLGGDEEMAESEADE